MGQLVLGILVRGTRVTATWFTTKCQVATCSPQWHIYALTVICLARHDECVTTTVFEVLAESRRRRILDLVRDRERSVGEIGAPLAMGRPAVSKHLRVLREAGLVEVRAA